MKEFHDFRDIEISNQELLQIIANKHQLDTKALDNYKEKGKTDSNNSKYSTEISANPN